MPQNTQQLPSELNRDDEMLEEIKRLPRANSPDIGPLARRPGVCSEDVIEVEPSTSKSQRNNHYQQQSAGSSRSRIQATPRNLTFYVHYLSSNYPIEIPETSTVADLKLMIFNSTNVAPCQQHLNGWRKEPKEDLVTLRSLNLPRENELYMSPVTEIGDTASQTHNLSERLASTFVLNIKDEANNITYHLNFPGNITIQDVKSSVYTLNDIPVRNQVWVGWPTSVKNDSILLAESGISLTESNFSVCRAPLKEKKKEVVNLVDTDSSTDEDELQKVVNLVDTDSSTDEDEDDFEDALGPSQEDDDIFIVQVQPKKIQHLIPDNVDDESIGTLHFLEEYKKRYGPNIPNFFTASLEDAVAESCSNPPRERKLLAVYLHHDNSILANVFCTQLLGSETILHLLSANFVVWGWDCTYESNKQKFLASVQQLLGQTVAMTVRGIDVDTMPVLMIIMKSRSNTDVIRIVYGNVGVNELLTNLIEAIDVFQDQRQSDIEFEDERQTRERVKEKQDQAYEESLAVDRAKEKAKQLMEKTEKQKKEMAEIERLAEQARKEAHRLAVESRLVPEPSQEADGVLKHHEIMETVSSSKKESDEVKYLESQIMFVQCFGYAIQDFSMKHFKLNLHCNVDSKDLLKEELEILLMNPSDDQKCLSNVINFLIQTIEEINSIPDVIDRYVQYFICFCNVLNVFEINKFVKNQNVEALKCLLKDAPAYKNYDDELRRILVYHL